MPAMPLDSAGRYVAAAYLVFMLILILYVSIMAMRLNRMAKDTDLIDEMIQARDDHSTRSPAPPSAEEEAGA